MMMIFCLTCTKIGQCIHFGSIDPFAHTDIYMYVMFSCKDTHIFTHRVGHMIDDVLSVDNKTGYGM